METRSTKTKAEIELQRQLEANTGTAQFAAQQLAELSAGTSRVEHDAVIVVHKSRPQAGTVRLGYVVNAATWLPQYRLRGARPMPLYGSTTSRRWCSKPARAGPGCASPFRLRDRHSTPRLRS